MQDKNYGEIFRKERKRLKLTQKEVGELIGIATCTISMKEVGVKKKFTVEELHRAYEIGIHVGLEKEFEFIDLGYIDTNIFNHLTERYKSSFRILNLSKNEIQSIMHKRYHKLTFNALSRMDKIMEYCNYSPKSTHNLTEDEKVKLTELVECYIEKYGNIQKIIDILEQDIQNDFSKK